MSLYFKLITFFQLAFITGSGQLPNSKYFTLENGFCSTTFFLDSIGNFYQEYGCEGNSRISLGTYILKGEKIDFLFQGFDSISPVYSMQSVGSSNDSIITVTLLTRQGQPIISQYFSVDAIDASGKFYKTLHPNESGIISVNFKKHKELRLDYLENIFGRKIRVPINDKDLVIVLSFPQLFFNYPRPGAERGDNFSLIIKKDGLYDITGKERLFQTAE